MNHHLHKSVHLFHWKTDKCRCSYTFRDALTRNVGCLACTWGSQLDPVGQVNEGCREVTWRRIGSHRKGQVIKHQDCESSYPVSDLQGINSELNLELTNFSPNAAGRTSWEGPAITARLTRDIRSPHSEVWRKMNWGSRARLPRRQGLAVSPPPVCAEGWRCCCWSYNLYWRGCISFCSTEIWKRGYRKAEPLGNY